MEEELIRDEARNFFKVKIKHSQNGAAIADFHVLKERLSDFYTSERKAVFLDEIEKLISSDLQDHRDKMHDGKAVANCRHEIKPPKLLFYINQERELLPTVARQKNSEKNQFARNKVFVSYSHFDQIYLKDIQRHFKPFLSQIDFWDDTKINPGQKWKDEIENAIKQTKVAILLVSTDFLGSDFISTNELPPLLEAAEDNGAVILTIILKPCLFEEFAELNRYQALNPPSRPLSKMDETEKEEVLVNMVRQTRRILQRESN